MVVAAAVSVLVLAAGPARSAAPFVTLTAYDKVGDFWFRTANLPPTADGRLAVNVLQIRKTTRTDIPASLKIEGRYLSVSCDWLTISEAQPSTYVEDDGEIRGGAVPGDGPAPLLQPQGGLGDQTIRQLCGLDKPPPGQSFASVAEALAYARLHQTSARPAGPTGPPPPAPELWKGSFTPVARSIDKAQMFLDRGWLVRSGDQVATRILVILGPTLNPDGEVVAIRNVRFDCKARTETLVEAWQWSLDRKHYSHAADIGWTRSMASRPFSTLLFEAACATTPPPPQQKMLVLPTVAEALAYAEKSWPAPVDRPPPERNAGALPASARYVYTKEVDQGLLYLGLLDDAPDEGRLLYWLVAVQRKPITRDRLTFSGVASLAELDCINAREREVGLLYFDASFRTLSSSRQVNDWNPVKPDTYGAALMATACEPTRPRWFGLEGLAAFQADYRKRLTRPPEPDE